MMLLAMLGGALFGGGILLGLWTIVQPRTSGPVALARFDAQLARNRRQDSVTRDRRHEGESARLRKIGSDFAVALDARGITLPKSLSANLAMVGMSREMFIARSLVGALVGFLLPLIGFAPLLVVGGIGPTVPLWLMILGAIVGLALPTLQLVRKAEDNRRAFRHVVSSFLDLVAMNLAGGRGVPEALQTATAISDGWGMVRIRDALEAARLQGSTPWVALGELGDEMDIDELRDLAAALALVAEDGAKVRDSLTARAESMRRRELAAAEGRAAARSQSMLVAQLLLCVGFLLFLGYPAVANILG